MSELIPSQVHELMLRTTDPLALRSLSKLYEALMREDDLLRIEAEDELDGVRLDMEGL